MLGFIRFRQLQVLQAQGRALETLDAKLTGLDGRIDALDAKLTGRIDALDAKFDQLLTALRRAQREREVEEGIAERGAT